MALKFSAIVALALGYSALALPSLLECATDSQTRMQIGGKAIMAGPTSACPANCPVKIDVSAQDENGNMKIVVTTSDVINFAVRVNDADGTLSSTHANISSQCSAQMHSVSPTGLAADTYSFSLAPANKAATPNDIMVTVGYAKSFAPGVILARHPPLPAAAVYRCVSNKCTASPTGVSMEVCKQICSGKRRFAPSPTIV